MADLTRRLQSNVFFWRVTVALSAFVITVLATFILKNLADLVTAGIQRSQIFWVLASAEVVVGVFWWGVGEGSRYQPPSHELRSATEGEQHVSVN